MADNSTPKDELIRRRIFFGTLSNYAGQIATLATWFFLTPFILGQLGPSDYGLWLLVSSVVAYGSLLDFGITSAIIKYVPEFKARNEMVQLQKLIATALRIYTVLGLIAFAICAALAPFFPALFNIPAGESNNAFWLVLIMGFTLGIEIPGMTAYSVLRGLQLFQIVSFLNVTSTLLLAAGTVGVLLAGGNLLAMIALNVPIALMMQWAAIRFIRRKEPEVIYGWQGASWEYVGRIVKFSSSIFVQTIGGQFQTKTDEIIIGAFLRVSAITPYSLARRLSEIPQLLTVQFIKVLLPLASQLQAENDHGRLRRLYLASTRLTVTFFLPVACTIVILGPEILTVWVGATYASSAHLITILAVSGLVITSQLPASSILQGIAKHRLLALTSLGSGIINLIISIILVQSYGITGVAIGTLIPTVIECLFIVLPYTLRLVGVKFGEFIREAILPAFLPVIPMVAVVYLLKILVVPSSIIALIFVGSLAALTYLITYLGISVSKSERRAYFSFASNTIQSMVLYFKR